MHIGTYVYMLILAPFKFLGKRIDRTEGCSSVVCRCERVVSVVVVVYLGVVETSLLSPTIPAISSRCSPTESIGLSVSPLPNIRSCSRREEDALAGEDGAN